MSNKDLDKNSLYEGVKLLLETSENHIHLPQQKLYTLVSICFNYLLFLSTKDSGHYIIRVEDSFLLDKIQKKSKDDTTRKFITKLALPRRLKYGNSTFHLDFFNFSSWANTNELPKDKIKAALIIKNPNRSPLDGNGLDLEDTIELNTIAGLPKDYYLTSLTNFVPKTLTIAFDENFEDIKIVNFPFIKEDPKEKIAKGVSISSSIDLDLLSD